MRNRTVLAVGLLLLVIAVLGTISVMDMFSKLG